VNATSVTGVTLVQAATMLATHLADHTLPEPAYLRVNTRHGHSEVAAQLHATTVPTLARDLLAWATTLPTVTGEAWRVHTGDRVHLSITSTLTGPAGAIELDVFGAVDYEPAQFADLPAGDRRMVSLGQLRTWAAFNVPRDRR
jgi:FtsP/CotA-like multicopper oxidase with cupredoxin domain